MFTPESLLNIALEQDKIAAATASPVGVMCSDDNIRARRTRERALVAAEWMEKNGIAEMAHVGDFSSFVTKPNQRLRLRKGAVIYSTNPQVAREGKINKLNRTIVVNHVIEGYVDIMCCDSSENPVRNAMVNWSGTGSYWYWTDINNLELVQE